jgi:two-component system chemotaxis response regulator CheV
MMMDVEKVLAETSKRDDEGVFRTITKFAQSDRTVFYADDSVIARSQIQGTLDAMGVKGIAAINGGRAWEELDRIATTAAAMGKAVADLIQVVLTDIEMPEIDGYMLTKKIKSDPRFAGIPVIMHSSLSGMSNQKLGQSVGVDEYVSKFEPQRLAETLSRRLAGGGEIAKLS